MKYIIKKILNSKGAMDTILVSLLLMVVGVGVVAGLSGWLTTQTKFITSEANTTIQKIISE